MQSPTRGSSFLVKITTDNGMLAIYFSTYILQGIFLYHYENLLTQDIPLLRLSIKPLLNEYQLLTRKYAL